MDIIWMGFSASLMAGLLTGVGAFGVFFIKALSDKLEDGLLSFAAGIMLAAAFFSLILPAMSYGKEFFHSDYFATFVVMTGILSGAAALYLIHRYLPHEHFLAGYEGPDSQAFGRIWLFVLAITLHNFPEGMEVGVGFAGGDIGNGIALATGIGIQNIPEGLAVAVALMTINYSKPKAFMIGFLTGLVEPIGGLVGSLAVSIANPFMPWSLAFAAGAMLFIISGEIIPETHRRGFKNVATFSLLTGFVLMMFIDTALS